jgi:hypothetical protein
MCPYCCFRSGRFMDYSYGAVAWLQTTQPCLWKCTLAVWVTNVSQCTQVGNIFFEDGSSSRQHGKSSREQTGTLTMISRGRMASLPYDILYHLLPNGKRSAISLCSPTRGGCLGIWNLESSRSLRSHWHQLVFRFRMDEQATIIQEELF